MSEHKDAFRHARQSAGILKVDADERDSVSLLLRLKDVRRAAKDWKTYSSNHPFMVLIHSEAHLRENRQVPIESDPPEHTTKKSQSCESPRRSRIRSSPACFSSA